MEGRMSVSNMAIEAGARAGLIAPDETTFEYLKGRPMLPGADSAEWKAAVDHWKSLFTDEGAVFDKEVHIDAADIAPTAWGRRRRTRRHRRRAQPGGYGRSGAPCGD